MTTITKPETMRQAKTWDASKAFYVRAGLCGGCAARISWGHQQGFRNVQPPCLRCLPVILGFPRNEVGEWRTVPQQLRTTWAPPVIERRPERSPHQLHPEHAGAVSLTSGPMPERHVLPTLTAA